MYHPWDNSTIFYQQDKKNATTIGLALLKPPRCVGEQAGNPLLDDHRQGEAFGGERAVHPQRCRRQHDGPRRQDQLQPRLIF